MAVVDPGVGSQRRAVCLRSGDGRLFVGPDNGLLIPAAEACGGIELAVELTSREHMLQQVSRTFHGRDVFAPVSGHLAGGLDPRQLGHEVDPATLVRVRALGAQLDGTLLTATVQHVDRFGNIQLSATLDDLGELFVSGRQVEVARGDDRYYATCALTFGDVDRSDLVLFEDSERQLAIAINRGSAAQLVDAEPNHRLLIEFSPAGP